MNGRLHTPSAESFVQPTGTPRNAAMISRFALGNAWASSLVLLLACLIFFTLGAGAMASEPIKPVRKPTNEVLELLHKSERMHSVNFSQDKTRAVGGYLALEEIKLSKDYGDALPKILEDLGEFDVLLATGASVQRNEDIDAVCKLVFLKSLMLGGPQVNDALPSRLHGFLRLSSLSLRDGSLTGESLGELAVLPELWALFLVEIQGWQPGACAQVAKIKKLRRFGAFRVGITDED